MGADLTMFPWPRYVVARVSDKPGFQGGPGLILASHDDRAAALEQVTALRERRTDALGVWDIQKREWVDDGAR